jgi:hypothetical protein
MDACWWVGGGCYSYIRFEEKHRTDKVYHSTDKEKHSTGEGEQSTDKGKQYRVLTKTKEKNSEKYKMSVVQWKNRRLPP